MINAVNTGVNRHAEMKAQWEYRKYILSQNFLKDIKQGSIFVVNKKDEIGIIDYETHTKIYIVRVEDRANKRILAVNHDYCHGTPY